MAEADYSHINDALLAELEEEALVSAEAHDRYTQTESYQASLRANYLRFHHYYAPLAGDQWPEDIKLRPEKIHMTVNIVKPAVNIDARLQSILPRISLVPDGLSEQDRERAEAAEKLMLSYLEASGWDIWLGDLCRTKTLYRKGVIKVFWNKADRRPDAIVLENPANLRIGWGSSDYRIMDWALYEYSISPLEASIRFDVEIGPHPENPKHLLVQRGTNHTDPLDQKPPLGGTQNLARPVPYQPSDYEQKQVRVWDYWYKKPDGKGGFVVCNAMFIEGVLVVPRGAKRAIQEHRYMPDIPYIVIENDHEPGSPEGMSTMEDLIDLQLELNRALSHWAQLIADEVDPAWQLVGENADAVPPGLIPRGGQVVAPGGGNQIARVDNSINTFPVAEFIAALWDQYHRITGLSQILFGQVPGAQTSGRAVAIQVEAAANRLDPKRRRLYAGLKELLVFWSVMVERLNPKVQVEREGQVVSIGLRAVVRGLRRWKIVAPEITPRDVFENTNNEINKVNAKLSSMRTAMDQIGIDSPEDELKLIAMEQMNAQLNPASVQAYVSIITALQAFQAQMAAMQGQLDAIAAMNPQAAAQDMTGVNAMQQEQFAAQPTLFEDQNAPRTQAGMAPPGGGQGPAVQQQLLVREGQGMSQLALSQEI